MKCEKGSDQKQWIKLDKVHLVAMVMFWIVCTVH